MTDSFDTPPPEFGDHPQNFEGSTPQQMGTPAEFVPRLIARLIDTGLVIALIIGVVIISAIISVVSSTLATLVGIVLYLAVFALAFYVIVGGIALTGQSPGQRMQGIKIETDSGERLGWGGSTIRWFVGGIFNSVLCGLPLGSLWMLWDGEKKTLYDKVLNNRAVVVPKGSITPIFPGGVPF